MGRSIYGSPSNSPWEKQRCASILRWRRGGCQTVSFTHAGCAKPQQDTLLVIAKQNEQARDWCQEASWACGEQLGTWNRQGLQPKLQTQIPSGAGLQARDAGPVGKQVQRGCREPHHGIHVPLPLWNHSSLSSSAPNIYYDEILLAELAMQDLQESKGPVLRALVWWKEENKE